MNICGRLVFFTDKLFFEHASLIGMVYPLIVIVTKKLCFSFGLSRGVKTTPYLSFYVGMCRNCTMLPACPGSESTQKKTNDDEYSLRSSCYRQHLSTRLLEGRGRGGGGGGGGAGLDSSAVNCCVEVARWPGVKVSTLLFDRKVFHF